MANITGKLGKLEAHVDRLATELEGAGFRDQMLLLDQAGELIQEAREAFEEVL